MSRETWDDVDLWVGDALIGDDDTLDDALRASDEAGLPQIAVSPLQGKMLYLLARIARARSILEIGTLGGYSTIWLARALPEDGRLVSLEVDERYAEVALRNVARGRARPSRVDIRVGPSARDARRGRRRRSTSSSSTRTRSRRPSTSPVRSS